MNNENSSAVVQKTNAYRNKLKEPLPVTDGVKYGITNAFHLTTTGVGTPNVREFHITPSGNLFVLSQGRQMLSNVFSLRDKYVYISQVTYGEVRSAITSEKNFHKSHPFEEEAGKVTLSLPLALKQRIIAASMSAQKQSNIYALIQETLEKAFPLLNPETKDSNGESK